MTIDEAIRHCEEVAERQEISADDKEMYSEMLGEDYKGFEEGCQECAADHRQLAAWLTELKELETKHWDECRQIAHYDNELKELREENKVLISECDRLIKEKGELLNKVSGGDVLRICQLEEQLEKAKRLLKAAVEDINSYVDCYEAHCDECCCDHDNHCHWKYEAEALKLIGGSENG